jgi:hypothetical protein
MRAKDLGNLVRITTLLARMLNRSMLDPPEKINSVKILEIILANVNISNDVDLDEVAIEKSEIY